MRTITASRHLGVAPPWAVMERALLDLLPSVAEAFVRRYADERGWLKWCGRIQTKDADDFYEPFGNWATAYLLGADESLLNLARRQWEAVTDQLETYGVIRAEYLKYSDQLHLSEAYVPFYAHCMAEPHDPLLLERAVRFAGFYLGDDPAADNFDPELGLVKAPVTGSIGPQFDFFGGDFAPRPSPHGLPYEDVSGIDSVAQLADPELSRLMGRAMADRMPRGDVAVNLLITSLVTNAFLMTGDERYRSWTLKYQEAWARRAAANGGLLPDNVGPSGTVGERLDGKWYGGYFGWTVPLGFYIIQYAAQVSSANAVLLSGDVGRLDLARDQLEAIARLGQVSRLDGLEMSLNFGGDLQWQGIQEALGDNPTFVVPYRHRDSGWFDFQPLSPIYLAGLWAVSHADDDWQRVWRFREKSNYDWRSVSPYRIKEGAGHEEPWLEYLAGRNPDYPVSILGHAYAEASRLADLIARDETDLSVLDDREIPSAVHHWQYMNPVTTEALLQLTLGAPQVIYNGGLLMAPIRYFDWSRRRPGLPLDVGALVHEVDHRGIRLSLVNLSPEHGREVVIQAGAMREHTFRGLAYEVDEPTDPLRVRQGALGTSHRSVELDLVDQSVLVVLPPASELSIRLDMEWYSSTPTYAPPWS